MPIPLRTNAPNNWHYHVYDIPCGHGPVAAGHTVGTCGPHVARGVFPAAQLAAWLPPVVAVAAADHTARAAAALPPPALLNVPIHPPLPDDTTGADRLSLRQDMADLLAVAGVGPPLNAAMGLIGQTYHGREIPYIMFGGNNVVGGAPQVLLTGGIHAREWLAVEVPYLIAEYLIKNYLDDAHRAAPAPASQARISDLVDKCRICVIPMLNPDGHCWSTASTLMDQANRVWRRNRRRWTRAQLEAHPTYNAPAVAVAGAGPWTGVDGNRNFTRRDGKWSPGDPRHETFAGPNALSEAETYHLNTFIDVHLTRLAGSIDYHSVMGRVLYHGDAAGGMGRRGGTRRLVRSVAQCMWEHISAYGGTAYGNGATSIEIESGGNHKSYGSVMDCCYEKMFRSNNVPLAYTIELDPIKIGPGNYNPPCPAPNARWFTIAENTIRPVFEKNLTAALCLMQYASQSFQFRKFKKIRVRRAGVNVAQARICPFTANVLDTVTKVTGRGNQAPQP